MNRQSQKFDFWKSRDDYLSRCTWRHMGNVLSCSDCRRLSNGLVLLALICQDLLTETKYERSVSNATLAYWLEQLPSYDLARFKVCMDGCLDILRAGKIPVRAFKRRGRDLDPEISTILGPVYLTLVQFMENGSADAFRSANTAIQFLSRLTLHDVTWVEAECVEKLLSFEDAIYHWTYPKWLLDELRKIMTEWLQDIDLEDLRPNHSNGATAEVSRGMGLANKYLAMSSTFATEWFERAYGPTIPTVVELPDARSSLCQIGIGQLVPKGLDKKRPITMETTCHQYYQKAVADAIRDHISRHPGRFMIRLDDQGYNRFLAWVGSHRRNYATVDLSSASDSVSLLLVEEVFRDTKLRPFLTAFRSPFLAMGDRLLKTRKFLPMGSDLCFPIESLVFSAIVKLALKISGCKRRTYAVYGDDIVVPRRAEQQLLRLLRLCHFQVNDSKTFLSDSSFKESCGIECYNGSDVTPLRISRQWNCLGLYQGPVDDLSTPDLYVSALDFCNRLFAEGFMSARRYLLRLILLKYSAVPFAYPEGESSRAICLHSWNPHNGHLRSRIRWSGRGPANAYQRLEYLALTPYTRTARAWDSIRYELTLREYSTTDRESLLNPLDRIEVRAGATTSLLRKSWVSLRL